MSISHHPRAENLLGYATGGLDTGKSLAIAVHLSFCAACRETVAELECIGGALLEAETPAALSDGALERALQRLSQVEPARSALPAGVGLPAALAEDRLGRWLWRGPGVHWRAVPVSEETDTRVFMLRVAPNTQLPHHTHDGFEWTALLEGAFRHQGGVYGPGDFDDADEDTTHMPVVEPGVACVCLVAMRGTIQLRGWQRVLQPFIRI